MKVKLSHREPHAARHTPELYICLSGYLIISNLQMESGKIISFDNQKIYDEIVKWDINFQIEKR
jgi:hypothetical protein